MAIHTVTENTIGAKRIVTITGTAVMAGITTVITIVMATIDTTTRRDNSSSWRSL